MLRAPLPGMLSGLFDNTDSLRPYTRPLPPRATPWLTGQPAVPGVPHIEAQEDKMSNYTAPAAPTATPAPPPEVDEPTPTPSRSPQLTNQQPVQDGPPYLPNTAILGGVPTLPLDGPICAVFLAFFLGGAILNMAIYQLNRRHRYKFLFSALLFGFCMARILALTMRLLWAAYPTNISIAIASQIFTAAGVLLLFATNLVFTRRLLRAYHPFFGWHPLLTHAFSLLTILILAVLLLVISATVQSFFTLDARTRSADRHIQLAAATFLAAVAGLPIPAAAAAVLVPRRTRIDRFGDGSFRSKFRLLLATAALLFVGAAFRAAAAFHPAPLRATPERWYLSKPAYYLANFGVELLVVYLYTLARFDRRFYVPDGSKAPGHYSCAAAAEYGGSAAAVAAALAEFEKGGGVGAGVSPGASKRSSAWSGRWSSAGKGGAVAEVTVPARVAVPAAAAARASVDTRRSRRTVRSGRSGRSGVSGRSVVFVAGTPQVVGEPQVTGTPRVTGSVEDELGEAVADADGVSRDAEFEWMARAMVRGAFGSLSCSRCSSPAALGGGGGGEDAGPVGSSVYSGDASSVYSGDPGFGGIGFGEPSPAASLPTFLELEPTDGPTSDVAGQEQVVVPELESGGGKAAPTSEPEVEERKSTPGPSTPARTSSPVAGFPFEPESTAEGEGAGEEPAVADPEQEEGGAASSRRFPLIPTDPH